MSSGRPFSWKSHAFCFQKCVLVFVFFAQMTCLANPTGGVVINGDALIQNSVPGLTTIVQSTDRAVIDWKSFSIGSGERTNFIVPNATSATLNRVLGCDPSILNGTLTSNGHLFLINSNGIIFGKGSTVDVGGLTASTLDLDNSSFMAGGEMTFKGSSDTAVKNAGMIRASSGDVFLIGYQVSNSGTIRAPNGTVGLAAGSEVLIMPVGDERVVVRNAAGPRKKTGVSNSGVIQANVAELKAHGGNVYALAIRNTGRVAATGVTVQGGRILLRADGGKIESTGSLVARGPSGNGGQIVVSSGRKGSTTIGGHVDADGPDGIRGKIAITGEKVEIRRAIAVTADGKTEGGQIDIGSDAPMGSYEAYKSRTQIAGTISASSSMGRGGEIRLGGSSLILQDGAMVSANGLTGGGKVFAGGGWSGEGAGLLNSTCVTVECDAVLTANALENGHGGKVVVTAGKELTFQGSLQASGGMTSGDGGHAELSAGESVIIDRLGGRVDLSASHGRAGSLLLQSSEWVISNRCSWVTNFNALDEEDVSNFLNSANLTIQTALRDTGGNGNIVLGGTVAWSSANSLTIGAACDFLMVNADQSIGIIDSQGGGDVIINAARSVSLETGTSIGTSGGNVLINAGQAGITLGGSIMTGGGNVSLTGVGVTSTGGAVNAGSGTILVDGNDGAVNLAGGLTTTNDAAVAVRIIDATAVTLGNITTGAAGTVVLGEAGGDNLSGAVSQTGTISAGIVIGNGGSTVTLDGGNTVGNLGSFTSTGAFTFNDAAGGLNVTGNVVTNGGAVTVSTAGGALALGSNNITSGGGNVSLTGAGVTSSGGAVNSGGGTILVDGNDGAVNLAGALTTTNETATAVRVIDATTVSLGNITTGAAGTVVLGEAGGDGLSGAVTQTGAINAGTVTGNGGSTVTLDGNNTVVNLGEMKSAEAFVFKDTTGGLNVTGNVTAQGDATISTVGGALALGSSNITTSSGNVSLSGAGVTSTGGTVNAGSGTILVDGNDAAVNLAGALTTTNETATAVRVVDATTASLGNITTGAAGTVVLGEAGGDNLSGAVTQTGAINAGTVVGNGGNTVTLDGSNTVVNLGAWTSADAFVFKDTTGGLNVTGNVVTNGGAVTVSTAGGALALGGNNVATSGGNVSLAGEGVTSTGGAVNAGNGTILVDSNDGAVNLAGALTTTNETATAVRVIDATTVSLGNITTGAAGTVVLGEAGGDNLSGAVTQTGVISAGTLTGNTGDTVALSGSNTVVNLGAFTSTGVFTFNDAAGGLNVTGAVTTGNNGVASIATTGGNLAVSTGSVAGAGVTLVTTGANDIMLGGNVDGNAGTVTLTSGQAISQSGGVISTTGTLTGSAGTTATLSQSNTVGSLGPFTSTGAFTFNDAAGGLNVTGNVATKGGAAAISTAGGALALGSSNITSGGGNVSLSGVGVTSTGGTVNAGAGSIVVDGNDGAVNLAGALTTTNGTATAVRVVDATTVSLGNITTGAAGTVVLGEAGGDGLSGTVTQTGDIKAANLILAGNGDFALTAPTNAIGTVATLGTVGSLALDNSTSLTIGTIGTASGLNTTGNIRVSTPGGMAIRENIVSQGGVIALNATSIEVNRATVSSTGTAAVTLTANQFLLVNQPVVKGVLNGTGGTTQITLNDANLTAGESYTIAADQVTAGTRIYAFQNISAIRLDLGAGDDRNDTDFFIFTQTLNLGGGTNKLFVSGVQPTSSPLVKAGFGTITFTNVAAPPPTINIDGTPFGSVLLQNAQPGSGPGGSSGSQTNNFNSTSTSGASPGLGGIGALGAAGGGIAAATSGLLANVAVTMSQNLGFVSAGGGAPPSLSLQSQMNATTSATAESELNAALGGDGTMGVRSSTGLVSVNPQGPPPSAGTVAQLDSGMGLGALSELSFGLFGVSQVTLNNQFGAQPINLAGTLPSNAMQQKLAQTASPESFSMLSTMLGGDGTARIDNASGTIAMDLKGIFAPAGGTQASLMSIISLGAVGELFFALGGTGESIVNDSHGLVRMDVSGAAASSEVSTAMRAVLAAPGMSQMSLMLGGDGTGLMQATDAILSTALDSERAGPFVIAKLNEATSQQSVEELDHATR
jgi:filamentous hemagglutinin family protein